MKRSSCNSTGFGFGLRFVPGRVSESKSESARGIKQKVCNTHALKPSKRQTLRSILLQVVVVVAVVAVVVVVDGGTTSTAMNF